jgi:glycosyltransferase involved in cell wall biosynthesis
MIQVEANACGKPVIGINAMAMTDTMVHGVTAFLAGIAQEIRIGEAILGAEQGYEEGCRVVFPAMRTADYRASVHDIAEHLLRLMEDAELRDRMGEAGRKHVVENFDYRHVAKRLLEMVSDRLGIGESRR